MSSCLLTTAWIWSKDSDLQKSIFLKSLFMVICLGWDWPKWRCIKRFICIFPLIGCWHCWATEWVRGIETTTQTVSGEIWRIMTPESWLESRWLMTSCTVIVRTCHKRKFVVDQSPFSSWPLNFKQIQILINDHSIVWFSDSKFLLKVLAFVRLFLLIWSGKQTDLSTDSMVFLSVKLLPIKPQQLEVFKWVKTKFINISNNFRIPMLSPVFVTSAGVTGCIPALSARAAGDLATVATGTATWRSDARSVIRADSCFVIDVTRTSLLWSRKSWPCAVKPFRLHQES